MKPLDITFVTMFIGSIMSVTFDLIATFLIVDRYTDHTLYEVKVFPRVSKPYTEYFSTLDDAIIRLNGLGQVHIDTVKQTPITLNSLYSGD